MPTVYSTQSGAHPDYHDLVSAVAIGNRDPGFPVIWRCPAHPQWLSDNAHPHRTNAYVAVMDSSPGGMEKMMLKGAQEQPPGGGRDSAKNAGE